MSSGPQSWAASILGFALAVLAACAALELAADLLRAALPVLLPAFGCIVLVGAAWHFYNRPRGW